MVDDRDAHRSRPRTEDSYGIPEDETGMLTWEFVDEAMAGDRNYWVSTTRPDGRPHARPVWGVWLDETFYCGSGERARWAQNLDAGSGIVVHRESGDDVVILEGTAGKFGEGSADSDLVERLDAAYEEKYGVHHGTPFWAVHPRKVLAWSDYPVDATRWLFE